MWPHRHNGVGSEQRKTRKSLNGYRKFFVWAATGRNRETVAPVEILKVVLRREIAVAHQLLQYRRRELPPPQRSLTTTLTKRKILVGNGMPLKMTSGAESRPPV